MSKNLLCPGQRIQTKKFLDNYDRIFKKGLLGDVEMRKNGVRRNVALHLAMRFEKKGWERVE